jgi:hypothetical protein
VNLPKSQFAKAFQRSFKTYRAIKRAEDERHDATMPVDLQAIVEKLRSDFPSMTDAELTSAAAEAARAAGVPYKDTIRS